MNRIMSLIKLHRYKGENWHATTMVAYSKEEEKVDKTREEAIFQVDGLENCCCVSVSSGTQ